MHGPSHWLGIDVHDVGNSGFMNPKGRSLEPGMVFTVEPGIYINENALENLSLMAGRMRASEEEIAGFIEKVKRWTMIVTGFSLGTYPATAYGESR